MKTTIEINGYQILVSEEEGKVLVSATKNDEVVEEFTLDIEGSETEGGESLGEDGDIIPFGAEEESDFGDDDDEDEDEDFGDDDDEDEDLGDDDDEDEGEDEGKLESFQSFVRKRK